MRWLWIGFSSFAFLACGGSDHPDTIPPSQNGGANTTGFGGATAKGGVGGTAGEAGKASTGGKAGGGGTGAVEEGGEGGAGGENALAPIVEIVSPAEALAPNGTPIITIADANSENVPVTCRVTPSTAPGATAVNSSTITITAFDKNGGELAQKPGLLASGSDYEAVLTLDKAENGLVTFRCEAYDKSKVPVKGSAEISTFVDRGPNIDQVLPAEPHALSRPTHFEFAVLPAPLWDDVDAGAAVGAVSLTVKGVPITTLALDPKRANMYVAEVDFTDTTLFAVTPTGTIPFTITAKNKRKPVAATHTASQSFELDGSGPVIAITNPTDKTVIVGGPTPRPIVFTVQDSGTGVDPTSVVVALNGSTDRYDPASLSWALTTPSKKTDPYTFTYKVDAGKFTDATAQVTMNIDANDFAGNAAVGKSLLLNIDNRAPLISLDPPKVRILTNSAPDLYCSAPFDPLGNAASDTDPVQLNALFRAFIWEQTNGTISSDILVYSGVDPITPHLYLQSDPTKAVIVDTNNDGVCDAINAELKSATRSIALDPIPATGGGDTNAPFDGSLDPVVPSSYKCSSQPVDLKGLCADNYSDMAFVAGQHVVVSDTPANLSAVWGVQVGSAQSLTCTGRKWELSPSIAQEGWQCLAASASDKVGNEGISPPLRVCFDSENTPFKPDCSLPAPSCTDGCIPPNPAFQRLIPR